jgi:hypothetical protein
MSQRWATLAASLFVSVFCGCAYAFGVFSPTRKKTFHWTQAELQIVATAANAGDFFGIVSGIFFDRYGPRLTAMVGAVIALVGWGYVYFAMKGTVDLGIGGFTCFYILANHGLCWLDTAAVTSNVHNFPHHTGLGKSIDGLSASVFSQVYAGFFAPSAKPFLFMLPLALFGIVTIAAQFLCKVDEAQRQAPVRMAVFVAGFSLSTTLAVFLLVSSLCEAMFQLTKSVSLGLTVTYVCDDTRLLYDPSRAVGEAGTKGEGGGGGDGFITTGRRQWGAAG